MTASRLRDALTHDLTVATRRLARRPGVAAAVVVTLALGIGANVAVFSLVDAALLARLPYPDPDRLVQVWEVGHDGGNMRAAWANFEDLHRRSTSFEALAAYAGGIATVLGAERPLRPTLAGVTEGFFRVYGVRPAAGRLPAPAEHRPGAEPVAVVSDRFWRTELGGPGRPLDDHLLEIEGLSVRVVGVLPPGFRVPWDADLWYPAELQEMTPHRSAHNFHVVGRLAEDAGCLAAEAELSGIIASVIGPTDDPYLAVGARLVPLADELAAPVRRPLLLLQGAALLVLLVACANLASTFVARGVERRGELAVRAALGAGRGRLLGQLFTESLGLAVLGAGVGVALAAVILDTVPRLAPLNLPPGVELGLDARALLVALGLSVGAAVLFGLLPALSAVSRAATPLARAGARGTDDRRRRHVWRGLVAVQVAVAMMLASGAGLLVRSFWRVVSAETGIETAGLVAMSLNLPAGRYPDDPAIAAYHDRLLADLETLPGVERAGLVTHLPLSGSDASGRMEVEGGPAPAVDAVGYRVTGGGYFEALGIPVLAGRTFDERDHAGAAHAVVVNRMLAERAWPGQDPLGKRMTAGGMDRYYADDRWAMVVGVVADVRHRGPAAAPQPEAFFSYRQRPGRAADAVAVVRAAAAPGAVADAVREAAQRLDPEVPVELTTMDEVASRALADRRFSLLLLGSFALLGLGLATLGIYGVVSYRVARRRREMGIRLALGAEPRRLRNAVVAGSMRTVALGLAAGLAGALALTRLLESLLYEIEPTDPAALAAAALVLAAAALWASAVPARRAARVDPSETLRSE